MNVERLKVLIKFMRSLPKTAEKHFNMRYWVSEKRAKKGACATLVYDRKRLLKCGTSACALGWAGTCKQLRNEGLVVKALKTDLDGGGITNTHLGMAFFELNEDDFNELFVPPHRYDTSPKEWADRAEAFVADRTRT